MEYLVVAGIFGAIIGYPIALGTGRPIVVALLLGVAPTLALMQLPPFIGLLLLPFGPGVILGCLGAWAYRRLKPRTDSF